MQLAHEFQAIQARQLEIRDDDIERFLDGAGQTFIAAPLDGHLMAFAGQHAVQRISDTGIVFDQQNFGGRIHPGLGQHDTKGCAMIAPCLILQRAAVFLHDAARRWTVPSPCRCPWW